MLFLEIILIYKYRDVSRSRRSRIAGYDEECLNNPKAEKSVVDSLLQAPSILPVSARAYFSIPPVVESISSPFSLAAFTFPQRKPGTMKEVCLL